MRGKAWAAVALLVHGLGCPLPARYETQPPARTIEGPIRGVAFADIVEPEGHRGYGTSASEESLRVLRAHHVEWISVSVYGFLDNQCDTTIAADGEAPGQQRPGSVREQLRQARREGMKVLLSPSLYVSTDAGWRGRLGRRETGGRCWRAQEWQDFLTNYQAFVLRWAEVAEEDPETVALLSVGLELVSTTASHPEELAALTAKVRKVYSGALTYSANWDEAKRVRFWGDLDLIGVNAFYPLTTRKGATEAQLRAGAETLAGKLEALSHRTGRRILFTEIGYKSQPDSAIHPWEWTQKTQDAPVDEAYQAAAYRAVFSALWDRPFFAGLFWWKTFTDANDLHQQGAEPQEPRSGFSPLGKAAAEVMKARFAPRPSPASTSTSTRASR